MSVRATSGGPWLGIDFSGDRTRWGAGVGRPAVWVSRLVRRGPRLAVDDLRPVQALPGPGSPFDRLVGLLAAGAYRAAAIDAPFSLPAAHVPDGGQPALLERVGTLDRDGADFPPARALLGAVGAPGAEDRGRKIFRVTERRWQQRGVNVRSTLWCGPRGGAAFTAACLTLLHRARRPLWPWSQADRQGLLAETFPAGQLALWGLPYERYNGAGGDAQRVRQTIVAGLRRRGVEPGGFERALLVSADALDAVVCALGAVAVTDGRLPEEDRDALASCPEVAREGWIALHAP